MLYIAPHSTSHAPFLFTPKRAVLLPQPARGHAHKHLAGYDVEE